MKDIEPLSEDYLKRYSQAIDKLVRRCRHYGWTRLALYGSGKHSARVICTLARQQPGLQIRCLLDDFDSRSDLAGIPIVRPADWKRFDVQAMIVSSDAQEEVLYQKARALKPDIHVERMYADDWPGNTPAINRLLLDVSDLPADMHKAGVMMTPVLEAMVRHTRDMPLQCTAETGSGKTTLLLSNLSKRHLVFSIDDGNDSITSVKKSPLFNRANVEWIEGPTQLTLPAYAFTEPLDFALIDGPHAYPFPDLEYYYLYPQLKEGALLVLDDIHIPNITNIFNFLKAEDMFAMLEVVECTAFFRRTSSVTFPATYDGWWWQGYNRKNFPLDKHPYLRDTLSSDAQREMRELIRRPSSDVAARNVTHQRP